MLASGVRDVAHQLALDLLAFEQGPVSLFEVCDSSLERICHRVERPLQLSHFARPIGVKAL
jgi:hypothetical protein